MRGKRKRIKHIIFETMVVAISIGIAILIVRSGLVHDLSGSLFALDRLGSFIAGVLFTSVFTTVPAIAILGELAQQGSVYSVAFWGALGAVVGDYVIFRFMRNTFADDVQFLLRHAHVYKIPAIFKTRLSHWVVPLVGAIIIASPLPDELGLAILGVSKINDKVFIPVAFVLNALGILAIGFIATSAL